MTKGVNVNIFNSPQFELKMNDSNFAHFIENYKFYNPPQQKIIFFFNR